jgi:hypothetical protein
MAIGHAPIQIPPISTVFKLTSPLLATSHGGGALVDMVVMGAEVPGSNPRASPPTAYAYSLTYGWCVLYGMFNIWLAHFIWYVLTYGLGAFYMICFNIWFGRVLYGMF